MALGGACFPVSSQWLATGKSGGCDCRRPLARTSRSSARSRNAAHSIPDCGPIAGCRSIADCRPVIGSFSTLQRLVRPTRSAAEVPPLTICHGAGERRLCCPLPRELNQVYAWNLQLVAVVTARPDDLRRVVACGHTSRRGTPEDSCVQPPVLADKRADRKRADKRTGEAPTL